MSKVPFSGERIEQIEHLKNTHNRVAKELDYIKTLQATEAEFTRGYEVDKAPRIEIYVFDLQPSDKARLLKAINKALTDEITEMTRPSVENILDTLEALYD